MKFNKGKCKVLNLGRNSPMPWYTLGAKWLEGSLAEKELTILAADKLTMS